MTFTKIAFVYFSVQFQMLKTKLNICLRQILINEDDYKCRLIINSWTHLLERKIFIPKYIEYIIRINFILVKPINLNIASYLVLIVGKSRLEVDTTALPVSLTILGTVIFWLGE